MINGKRIVVVLPAYNAESTLDATVREIPEIVDETILVDDLSTDGTVRTGPQTRSNRRCARSQPGYGGNQKTCYAKALAIGSRRRRHEPPRLPVFPLAADRHGQHGRVQRLRPRSGIQNARSAVHCSGGMPLYKYVANRALTTFQNLMLGAHLSEYHTGYRAYSAALLRSLPWTITPTTSSLITSSSRSASCLGRGRRNLLSHPLLSGSLIHQLPPAVLNTDLASWPQPCNACSPGLACPPPTGSNSPDHLPAEEPDFAFRTLAGEGWTSARPLLKTLRCRARCCLCSRISPRHRRRSHLRSCRKACL